MRLKTLEDKVRYRINRSRDNVFVPADFFDLGGRDQVGRALRSLIMSGALLKIGYGLYVKASYSELFKKILPVRSLPELTREAMVKLGVRTAPAYFEKQYFEGKSTQVPTGRVIGVKDRISRKIRFGTMEMIYERISK